MSKIFLATDHAGFAHKEFLKEKLRVLGHEVVDCGAETHDSTDDYPDYIEKAAHEVVATSGSFGVIFGYSGQGEAMCANRATGARAAVYYGGAREMVKLSREHNNANILSLGAGFISKEEALDATVLWLATSFSNEERHVRRIKKLDD